MYGWGPHRKLRELEDLEARKKLMAIAKKYSNTNHSSGPSVYYFCKVCNMMADLLPKDHPSKPREYCPECQGMIDHGYSPEKNAFTD